MSNDKPSTDTPVVAISGQLSPEEVSKRVKISEDFYTVYSNYSRVAMSEDECRFFFGEMYPTVTNELVITENFCIAMSPQRAKALLAALSQTIDGYEKLFSQIKPHTLIPTAITTKSVTDENKDKATK